MSLVCCPHCGSSFTVLGWEDLDHCARCGKPLATQNPRPARERVQEWMSLRPVGNVRTGASGPAGQERDS